MIYKNLLIGIKKQLRDTKDVLNLQIPEKAKLLLLSMI